MLSYFFLLDIDLCFGNWPRQLWFMSKKICKTKQTFVNFNFLLKLKYIAIAAQLEL